jgi:N-acetylglucosaminyldiphosphoundecaprenol N-acetyl-beta-D-mannosaminyltransferase
VFDAVHASLNRSGGGRIFFLGGAPSTLALIEARMKKDYPALEVAGTYSPPFKPVYSPAELDEMIAAVNAARADVLWVGLTAPKQEKWIFTNQSRLNVRFIGAVGAVFDFYAGTVTRSPAFFRKIGLEWLPRFIQQPRRLGPRLYKSAPVFLWHTLRARIGLWPHS